jgi:hypothetical protein
VSTADLLASFEQCPRKGFYSRDWQPNRMTGVDMLQEAVRTAVLESERKDYGALAGETVMELADVRGMDTTSHEVYQSVCHHAVLSDTLSTAIRRKERPWSVPESLTEETYPWESGALISPCRQFLRRFVFVSSWSDERKLGEYYSWKSLGEVAHYRIPMQMIVAVLGPHRDGKRHSYFTKGLIHPKSGKLRFRKKSQTTTTDFKDSWVKVWREDRSDISTLDWLDAMHGDGVLSESLFTVEVPVPEESTIGRWKEMAAQKLERLRRMDGTPEPNVSTCFFPIRCSYLSICHGNKWDKPSEKAGFVPAQSLR